MPVIYIKKEHYDKLIKQGEDPKKIVDQLLVKHLEESA